MPTIPAVFAPVAPIFTLVASILETIAAIFQPVPQSAVVPRVAPVLAAVPNIFTPIPPILAAIADVFEPVSVGSGPLLLGERCGQCSRQWQEREDQRRDDDRASYTH